MSVQARYCAAATGAAIDKKVQTTDVKLKDSCFHCQDPTRVSAM